MHRIARLCVSLSLLGLGCARLHLGPWDADRPTVDAGPVTGLDAAADRRDAGRADVDPSLPVQRWDNPNDARQCLSALDLVLEDEWPSATDVVFRGELGGLTVTPLVLPSIVPGTRPRLAFTTHWRRPVSEAPHPTERMYPELGGVLRILDLETRAVVSTDPIALPLLSQTATPAAGDVDGDGELELVVLGSYAGMYIIDERGELERTVANTPPLAPPIGTLRHPISVSGSPIIADLEGDSTMEIVIGSCVVEGATGRRRFCGALEHGQGRNEFLGPISTLYDIDDDGELEILAGRTAFEPDGTVIWHAGIRAGDDGFAVAGELLPEHPGPEIALVSEDFVYTLDAADGSLLHVQRMALGVAVGPPRLPPPPAYQGGPPLLVDVDLDGNMEIGVVGSYQYQLIEPEDPAGNAVRWSAPITDLSSMATAMATDLTGDGYPEIVLQDEVRFRVIDARTGQVRFSARSESGTRTEYPVIADVDLDGSSEILVPTFEGLRIYGERGSGFTSHVGDWLQHGGPRGDGARTVQSVGPAAPSGTPDHRPDVWIASVEARCTADAGEVRVTVRNLGGEPITAASQLGIAVSSPAPMHLASVPFEGPIAPGEEIVVVLPFAPRAGTHDYFLGIPPIEGECNTANNELQLPDMACPR